MEGHHIAGGNLGRRRAAQAMLLRQVAHDRLSPCEWQSHSPMFIVHGESRMEYVQGWGHRNDFTAHG
jgi:hypothetical protein